MFTSAKTDKKVTTFKIEVVLTFETNDSKSMIFPPRIIRYMIFELKFQ